MYTIFNILVLQNLERDEDIHVILVLQNLGRDKDIHVEVEYACMKFSNAKFQFFKY